MRQNNNFPKKRKRMKKNTGFLLLLIALLFSPIGQAGEKESVPEKLREFANEIGTNCASEDINDVKIKINEAAGSYEKNSGNVASAAGNTSNQSDSFRGCKGNSEKGTGALEAQNGILNEAKDTVESIKINLSTTLADSQANDEVIENCKKAKKNAVEYIDEEITKNKTSIAALTNNARKCSGGSEDTESLMDKTKDALEMTLLGGMVASMFQGNDDGGSGSQFKARPRSNRLGGKEDKAPGNAYAGKQSGGAALTDKPEEDNAAAEDTHSPNTFGRGFPLEAKQQHTGALSGGTGSSSLPEDNAANTSEEKAGTEKGNKQVAGRPPSGGLLGLGSGGGSEGDNEFSSMLEGLDPGRFSFGEKGTEQEQKNRDIASAQSSELFKMIRKKIKIFRKKGDIR